MNQISMLIAGDFCIKNFEDSFFTWERIQKIAAPVQKITRRHDISVVNVETVYSDCDNAIKKSGPNLKSPLITLQLLKEMQFTVGACANNHIGDYGEQGVLDTLGHLREIGLVTVGAGKNAQEAEKICYLEQKGMKIGLINCAEHEFGTARETKAGTAGMDYYITGGLVRQAEKEADAVVVYIHGGNENAPLPRPGMKKFCHYLAECGATAIVIAHSHCPQGIEVYQGVPIAYGIGNFYFPGFRDSKMWNNGYLVSITLKKGEQAAFEVFPYRQEQDGTAIHLLQGHEKEQFLKYISCISDLMQEKETYEKMTLAWADLYMAGIQKYLERTDSRPHSEQTLFVRNSYTCESHSELMATYYEAFCDGRLDGLEKYKKMIRILQRGETI